MKKHFITLLTLATVFNYSIAQTNVSGGIYSNTTWTKANSPYIVKGSIVVFPGINLNIEPGVVVRFEDTTGIEIRGTLNSLGTKQDSIKFTSNSSSPYPGIWSGITISNLQNNALFHLNYTNFYYSTSAINYNYFVKNNTSNFIKHSSFFYNTNCIGSENGEYIDIPIDSFLFINNVCCLWSAARVTNCIFINNQFANIVETPGPKYAAINCIFCGNTLGCFYTDSIINCSFSQNRVGYQGEFTYMSGNIFRNNDTAIICSPNPTPGTEMFNNSIYNNNIGIFIQYYYNNTIFNNKICHNKLHNIAYMDNQNISLPNNCWCEYDSLSIRKSIYDGYDNVSLGLIQFTPFNNCDTAHIADISFCSSYINIDSNNKEQPEIKIHNFITPNNDGHNDTWEVPHNDILKNADVSVYNSFGQKMFSTTGWNNKWDGTYRGEKMETGEYYYIIKYSNGTLKGVILLMQ